MKKLSTPNMGIIHHSQVTLLETHQNWVRFCNVIPNRGAQYNLSRLCGSPTQGFIKARFGFCNFCSHSVIYLFFSCSFPKFCFQKYTKIVGKLENWSILPFFSPNMVIFTVWDSQLWVKFFNFRTYKKAPVWV